MRSPRSTVAVCARSGSDTVFRRQAGAMVSSCMAAGLGAIST